MKLPIIFIFIVPILMLSMIAGIIVANNVKTSRVYNIINKNTLFKKEPIYKLLGTEIIKRLIIYSPLRYFNREIKIEHPKIGIKELQELKLKMTNAEIGHIIGFIFIIVTTGILIVCDCNIYAIIILNLLNIVFNLYPILIQQQNKLRIDIIIKKHRTTFNI